MRAFVDAYELHEPKNFQDALSKVKAGYVPFAGGTDLMVQFEAGKLPIRKYLSLWNLKELKGIDHAKDYVTLGSLTTYAEIRDDDLITKEFPNLVEAARETGAIAIQNRGTIGGNIANASPAADSPPALLVYDAELELTSGNGSRWLSYDGFHIDYKKTQLRAGEIITKIRIPRATNRSHFYRKVGTRKAQAITKVGLAATAIVQNGTVNNIRLALTSVAPIPFRCHQTEKRLEGQKITAAKILEAQKTLAQEIAPIDDIRSTQKYRLTVAQNLIQTCFRDWNLV